MTSAQSTPSDGRVGRYRLLAPIGEGGMGVVHVAQAPDGSRVALKVLRPHVVGDAEARERLAREVASLRKVRSRHVAEILDAEPHGDAPFIVTRYVPGLSLHDTVRQDGPLPPGDLAFAARHLLQAVRDVHGADVLHRDIKPTNVVMEGRAPILIDFGLARLAEDPRLTATGWLLGSPGYLAPEVLFGDDATTATDVHGWAATVVHAATGRSPYGRGHTMAILDRTRRGEIDLRGVPDPLRLLLAQCLALEALDRPTTREVAAELDLLDADVLATTAMPVCPREAPTGPAAPTQPWQLGSRDRPGHEAATARVQAAPVPPTTIAPAPPTRVEPRPPTRIAPVPVTHPAAAAAAAPVAPGLTPPGPPGHPSHLTPPSRIASAPRSLTDPQTSLASAPHLQQWPTNQPPTALRPLPQLSPLVPMGPPPLTRVEHLRRSLVLLAAASLVVVSFRTAPYLTAGAVALVALATRGVSRAEQALSKRRSLRGARWHDTPRSVLGYPWHLLRGAAGAVVLIGCAAAVSAAAVAGLVVLGVTTATALLAGGAFYALVIWNGPGSSRVRGPLGRAATTAARSPALSFVVLGIAVVALVAAVSAYQANGVSWAPDSGAPWRDLPFSLAGALGLR